MIVLTATFFFLTVALIYTGYHEYRNDSATILAAPMLGIGLSYLSFHVVATGVSTDYRNTWLRKIKPYWPCELFRKIVPRDQVEFQDFLAFIDMKETVLFVPLSMVNCGLFLDCIALVPRDREITKESAKDPDIIWIVFTGKKRELTICNEDGSAYSETDSPRRQIIN